MARLVGVNKSKLSYYVSKGLLVPTKEVGGMYVFDRRDTARVLKRIKKYREQKFTLDDIRVLLKQ